MKKMNKKILTLITAFLIMSASGVFAQDLRIAEIDSAFTPSVQESAADNSEVKTTDIKEKKKHNLKFWKNIKKKNAKSDISESGKKKTFQDAKKYAIDAYQEKTRPLEKPKKEKKAKKKQAQEVEVKNKTPQMEVQTKPVKSKKTNKTESDSEIKLQSDNSQQVIQAGVSTNKIINVDDCVKIALENNPVIVSQIMNKEIYKNKIAQAWANYFPTINASAAYSKNDMLMTNFKFPMQKYTLWNTPAVGVNLLLFDFGKTSTSARISKKTYEAAEDTMQANINDIIFQVKNAYYNLLYAMQQVQVYEDTVANYEIHLKQAQAYYDIGSKAKIDVITAAYNLDNAKLNLIQAKNAVDTSYAQLNNAMGVPEFSEYSIKEKLTSRKYDVIFDDVLTVAYDQRPELLAAKKKMEGSQLLVRATKVAFLPDIQGFGSYTNGGKRPGDDYSYQVGAQVGYSNLNLYLLKKQVDEAKLTYLKDKADYEVQRQSVYLDVKQAYIQFKNAQESIPVAKSNMRQAKEQYDLASGRYKVGLGDAVELKDAENTYRTAQLNYYNTLTQYNISAANLEKVVGSPILPADSSL